MMTCGMIEDVYLTYFQNQLVICWIMSSINDLTNIENGADIHCSYHRRYNKYLFYSTIQTQSR